MALQTVALSFSWPHSRQGNESDALFFVATSRTLAELENNGRIIVGLDTFNGMPIAFGDDGALIVALEWDYAAWTQAAAGFIGQLQSAQFSGNPPSYILVGITGDASPLTQQSLQDAGIRLAMRLAPGPLLPRP